MYSSDEINSKLKRLTHTIYDTSNNLKSLDYLLLNPVNPPRTLSSYGGTVDRNGSFSKIEQSLENISSKQNRIEDEMKRMSSKLKDDNTEYANFPNYSRMSRKAASTNFLDIQEPIVDVSSSVSKKLQDAQDRLRNERIITENRMASSTKCLEISTDLKTLIEKLNSSKQSPNVDNQQLELLTKRIMKSESENSTLKFEFDSLKRQFSNEMGAKNALSMQLDNAKVRVQDCEEKRISMKKDLERMAMENDVLRKKTGERF